MKKTPFIGLAAAALALFGTFASSSILELSLDEIVTASDEAVYGEIVNRQVHKVVTEESTDYFTTLTIEGRLVGSKTPITVDVVYGGGFITEEDGVHNSEAPSAAETQIGQTIIAFYDFQADFPGSGANVLYNMHGGLYRTDVGPAGTVVLGRGQGYAINRNVSLVNLDGEVSSLKIK
ncbi:MAG: hypothetical protein ACI82F_003586 [Planctomycetota bacterium]|jgi:hypothetical protein